MDDLTGVLWGIDCHLDMMHKEGQTDKEGNIKFGFPALFRELAGYHDFAKRIRTQSKKPGDYHGYDNWRKKGTGRPKLTQEKLKKFIDLLANMLLRPHLQQQTTGWELFYTACSNLKTVLTNWELYLRVNVSRTNETRADGDGNFTVATEDDTSRIIEASFCTVAKWASSLYDRLKSVDAYQPMLLNEYLGEGTSSQCKNSRIKNLKLPCAVKLYTHVHHGDRNLYFIWKLPPKKDRTEQQNDQVINQVRDRFPFYSSRATRAHFSSLLTKLGMSGPLEGTAARKLLKECFSDVSL